MPALAVDRSWAPQKGSQQAFLEAPFFEVLYHGSRGPGKTIALLMDFAQHVGQGYGRYWRGILFREEVVQLADLIEKSMRFFPAAFPGARFVGGNEHRKWIFPDGEELLLRHIRRPEEYQGFHGWEVPWIGWDELTNWAFPDCYTTMMSIVRSSGPAEMPRKVRATCNPYGKGRGWVKARFIDPAPDRTPITDEQGRIRMAVRGSIRENRILLASDPAYMANLRADPDENRRKAWLDGSWDAVSGGIFDGKWDEAVNVMAPFRIPASWRADRSFDWGSSRPYAVCYWAESDGTPAKMADGTERNFPRGTLFLIAEIYGWTGKANEGTRETVAQIAAKVREADAGLIGTLLPTDARVYAGPADTSIFDVINGDSIADEMARHGVSWTKANKGAGSRVHGWERLGAMFLAARAQPMEHAGLFVFDTCRNWLRTVPHLARDVKRPDDVDTEQEDHCGDAARYRILREAPTGAGVLHLKRVY